MKDWLTLRAPLALLPVDAQGKLRDYLGCVMTTDSNGEIQRLRQYLDIDSLRSDSDGLFWEVRGSSEEGMHLYIGASPAQIEHGNNVFGSDDIVHCAEVLIRAAAKTLGCIMPNYRQWTVRRLDQTENYDLGSLNQVKQALRILMACDASRQKANGDAGDSVYWGKKSDLFGAKAYAKGPQLLRLWKKGKTNCTEEQIKEADRLLRFEASYRSRWWRRFYESGRQWWDVTEKEFIDSHSEFFGKFVGRVEVADMGQLIEELEKVAPTKGQAIAAHRTWAVIRSVGYELARESMPKRTFCRHQALLRMAGLSDADLQAGNVVPFRRSTIVLNAPCRSWLDLRNGTLH